MPQQKTLCCEDAPPFGYLTALPSNIISLIFSYLPKPLLLLFRCVNQHFSAIATPLAFRSLSLLAYGNSPERFINIAQSDKLRGLVRELICNTRVSRLKYKFRVKGYAIPANFYAALPFLRHLRNLDTLQIFFNEICAHDNLVTDTETTNMRYRVLDTLFHCLAGTWSARRQAEIDKALHSPRMTYTENERDESAPDTPFSPILLNSLSVHNLAEYNDRPLTESRAFKRVLASSTLVELELHFVTGVGTPAKVEIYENVESLPRTWLSPPAARHLKVLVLKQERFWGWLPRMNFQAVELPNLKVLTLGRYIFSHEWQVGWISSLGLEELVLEDCPILHQAYSAMAWGTTVVGQDANGDDIIVSNEGYPRGDVWDNLGGDGINSADDSSRSFRLRWHSVVSRWCEEIPTLRFFQMEYKSVDNKNYVYYHSGEFYSWGKWRRVHSVRGDDCEWVELSKCRKQDWWLEVGLDIQDMEALSKLKDVLEARRLEDAENGIANTKT
ncbi:Fc.00g096070.m01.CDS01 [Cosmosporella sp. VM-42]